MTQLIRWFVLLAACSALNLVAQPRPPAAGNDKAATPELGCVDCHAEIAGNTTRPQHFHGKCESCHAGGAGHIAAMQKAEPAKGTIQFPDSQACLTCHAGNRKLMNWQLGVHAKAQETCAACHSVHASPAGGGPNLAFSRSDAASVRCAGCHQDVRARFNLASHHPVKEGGMACASCHDPHGGGQAVLRSNSEQCLSCHQALRGPMVFEHAPVAEDCMNCHDPHGSTSRRLLTAAQPSVCLQCHPIAQGKHGFGTGTEPAPYSGTRTISGAVLRNCTNCHSAVHGSHQDPLLRY